MSITYFERPNKDGSTSVLTIIHVKGIKPHSKSFRTSKKAPKRTLAEARKAAQAWAEPEEKELQTEAELGDVRADLATLTIGGLIKEYLADPKVKTLRSYENIKNLLNWWLPDYAKVKVRNIGPRTLRAAREKLQTTGRRRKARAAGTVNRHLSVMRKAWNWGRTNGYIPTGRVWPTGLLLPEPRGPMKILSDKALARVLKATKPDPVMYAATVVAIATGIRRGELLRLQWKDIDLDGNKLTLHITKTNVPRVVYLASSAVAALRVLKEAEVVSLTSVFLVSADKPLNGMVLRVRWNKIRKAAELGNFRWHDLRHSNASFLGREGASLLQIGEVLGHKSTQTTKRYAHFVQGEAMPGHAQLDKLLWGKP